ncbi:MAG TPA: c-type cytochrome [Polyangiaceae bacterium]|nr:c-type cytochrome [Polyangiaceae bacterium]
MRSILFVPPLLALALACSHRMTPQEEAMAPHSANQVEWGQKLYGEYCAECHGDKGQGNANDKHAPPVVGKEALPLHPREGAKRAVDFHTAADVAAFVVKNMPGDAPGSLTPEEYYAILAFDLHANGVDLAGKQVDATTAASFVLHP